MELYVLLYNYLALKLSSAQLLLCLFASSIMSISIHQMPQNIAITHTSRQPQDIVDRSASMSSELFVNHIEVLTTLIDFTIDFQEPQLTSSCQMITTADDLRKLP